MPRLAHHVSLNDASEASTRKPIDACKTYLDGHEGVVDFSVGRRESASIVR